MNYIKYFLSYLVIFTVMILGFLFITKNQLAEKYFQQRSEQAYVQLASYAEQLNNDIVFLNNIDSSIRTNSELLSNRYKEYSAYKYKFHQELTQYTHSVQLLQTIAHLRKETGEVISTNYLITWENNIFHITDTNLKTIVFDPAPYYGDITGQLVFIANESVQYLLYLPATGDQSNNIYFYILDTDEIRFKQKSLISEEIRAIALVDSGGQFVVGNNTSLLAPHMDSLSLEDGIYKQDSNTSICVLANVGNEFAVVAMLSNEFLSNQINETFGDVYLALLLLSVVGLFLILFVMRFTYLPLHKLTQKIVPNPNARQNYLHQLDAAFSESERQNKLLHEKLDNYRLSIQKSLLNSMLNIPNPNSKDSFFNIDQFFDKNINNKIFVLKIASFSDFLPKEEIQKYFAKSFPSEDSCILLEFQENSAVFLINDTNATPDKDKELRKLADKLYEEQGYYSAISNASDSPLDIPSLYANTIHAASYWSQFPVVEYQALPQMQTAYTYPHDELNRLSTLLKENHFAAADELINTLFHELDHYTTQENNLPAFFVRCVLIDMLTIIVNCMTLCHLDFCVYSEQYFETLYLCRSCSYQEKADEIKLLVKQLVTFYEQSMKDRLRNSTPIREVMEEYYCQPDFSIAILADKFHVSTTYMSTTFKKELNINFSEYLWMLRLNKAKNLLKNTDLSINEISTAVGYVNTTSFQRKFKQETGLTPSQFRAEPESRCIHD